MPSMRSCSTFLGLTFLAAACCADVHAQNAKPIDPHEKRFTMEFKDAPWPEVFDWIDKQSGLPFTSSFPAPRGKFTYSSKGKKVSAIEAIDIINDSLVLENHVIIRQEKKITLANFDESPEYTWPFVKFTDLYKRQKHVPVVTIFTPRGVNIEDLAISVKHSVGPGGQVFPVESQIQ